jgi:hypothetical protein
VSATLGADAGGEPGEGDVIDLSVETLRGGAGPDRLVGAVGVANGLIGEGGDDLLIAIEDGGEADTVVCGAGADRASIDTRDAVSADCERVRRDGRVIRPAPAPRVFVGARRLRVDASRRFTLSLQCAADAHWRLRGHRRPDAAPRRRRIIGFGAFSDRAARDDQCRRPGDAPARARRAPRRPARRQGVGAAARA